MTNSFRPIGPTTYLCPTPVVLVGCADAAGKADFLTAAWAGICCSHPPVIGVGIRPERYSHGLITAAGEFTVNLTNEALCRATDLCGMRSGRDVDKLALTGLHAVPAPPLTRAPALLEAPAHLCCTLTQVVPLGSHDLFLGEIKQVYVAERYFRPDGSIDEAAMKLIAYVHGKYCALGDEQGFFGFSIAGPKALRRRKG